MTACAVSMTINWTHWHSSIFTRQNFPNPDSSKFCTIRYSKHTFLFKFRSVFFIIIMFHISMDFGCVKKFWSLLLLLAILSYPVDCVHFCHLLRAQHYCLCSKMVARTHLWLAHPPPPLLPFSHPFIHETHDITGALKNYFKNQQWIMCSRVSYETPASYKASLLIQQIWCGYNVA